jgi:antitoxin VapB
MALNIENIEIERLAGEVAVLAHETQTEAIGQALVERRARLQARASKPAGRKNLPDFFEQEVWPLIPANELGRALTRGEEDEILGYGKPDLL